MIYLGYNGCSSPAIGTALSAFQKMLKLIQILAPIVLIVGLTLHITKLMQNPDDKKQVKKIFNSVLAAFFLFFVPMFVNVVMGMLGNDFSVSSCWNSIQNPGSSTTYVDPYQGQQKAGFITSPDSYEKGKPVVVGDGEMHETSSGNMKYYVYLPKNSSANMPLLVWLHGDGASESYPKSKALGQTAEKAGYPAIVIQPYSPNLGSKGNPGWAEGNHLKEVKAIVDEVCAKYQCDTTNINVGGHSRGAIGAWMMGSAYGSFFHSVAPISCCSIGGFQAKNYQGIKVWAMRGSGAGSGYSSDDIYGSCMQRSVNAVKPYAKEVRYTILPRTTHGGAGGNAVSNQEMVKFIFSK